MLESDDFQSLTRDWKSHVVANLAQRRHAQVAEEDEIMEAGVDSGSPSEAGEEEDDDDGDDDDANDEEEDDDDGDDDNANDDGDNGEGEDDAMDDAPSIITDTMLENIAAGELAALRRPRTPPTGPPSPKQTPARLACQVGWSGVSKRDRIVQI